MIAALAVTAALIGGPIATPPIPGPPPVTGGLEVEGPTVEGAITLCRILVEGWPGQRCLYVAHLPEPSWGWVR